MKLRASRVPAMAEAQAICSPQLSLILTRLAHPVGREEKAQGDQVTCGRYQAPEQWRLDLNPGLW